MTASKLSKKPESADAAVSKAPNLTETVKTLQFLAHEQGHVTYDDINDILPDGLSPDDLDELYTKLRILEVEIVDHAEVDKLKPAESPVEPEEEARPRPDALDDPVGTYTRELGKVRVLDAQVDDQYTAWRNVSTRTGREKAAAKFRKTDKKLQAVFPRFFFKQKFLEDMIAVAANVREQFNAGLGRIQELEGRPKSTS